LIYINNPDKFATRKGFHTVLMIVHV